MEYLRLEKTAEFSQHSGLSYGWPRSRQLAVPLGHGGDRSLEGCSGPVVLSAFIHAVHSLRWIIMTKFANDTKLGGIADMFKDTARIEYSLGRLEKCFGRKVEWHHVRKSAVSGTSG